MTPPILHPSSASIRVGSTVAYRDDTGNGPGRVIGQVDSLGGGPDGWAIVSWPAQDQPHARTDGRGRRGQAFSLRALMLVDQLAGGEPV